MCFWIAVIAGLLLTSWWVFLVVLFTLIILPQFDATKGLFSIFWSLAWTATISIPVGIIFSVGAGVTAALFVFALTYVPMRSSEQYWRDLERDGGPWAE